MENQDRHVHKEGLHPALGQDHISRILNILQRTDFCPHFSQQSKSLQLVLEENKTSHNFSIKSASRSYSPVQWICILFV